MDGERVGRGETCDKVWTAKCQQQELEGGVRRWDSQNSLNFAVFKSFHYKILEKSLSPSRVHCKHRKKINYMGDYRSFMEEEKPHRRRNHCLCVVINSSLCFWSPLLLLLCLPKVTMWFVWFQNLMDASIRTLGCNNLSQKEELCVFEGSGQRCCRISVRSFLSAFGRSCPAHNFLILSSWWSETKTPTATVFKRPVRLKLQSWSSFQVLGNRVWASWLPAGLWVRPGPLPLALSVCTSAFPHEDWQLLTVTHLLCQDLQFCNSMNVPFLYFCDSGTGLYQRLGSIVVKGLGSL